MLHEALRSLMTRELRAVKRELDLYPDDTAVWAVLPGVPNTAGTLALHLAGNIQHFFGAVLGRTGYVRDRAAEFARRDVSRAELQAALDAAITAVDNTLAELPSDAFLGRYPEPIAGRAVSTSTVAMHLLAHLAYHLGQIDIHRRAVTGDAAGVDAISVRELPEVR